MSLEVKMVDLDCIGKNIKSLRLSNGLTQVKLASKISSTQDTISLWECGKSYPDAESLIVIAKFFNVTVDDLLNFKKQKV